MNVVRHVAQQRHFCGRIITKLRVRSQIGEKCAQDPVMGKSDELGRSRWIQLVQINLRANSSIISTHPLRRVSPRTIHSCRGFPRLTQRSSSTDISKWECSRERISFVIVGDARVYPQAGHACSTRLRLTKRLGPWHAVIGSPSHGMYSILRLIRFFCGKLVKFRV